MNIPRRWTLAMLAALLGGLAAAALCWLPGLLSSPGPPAGLVGPTSTPSVAPTTRSQPAGSNETEAFRRFVMFDREREPEWLGRITAVRFTDTGALWAETTFPPDWSDSADRTRPVESICQQLTAYVLRGAQRSWAGVSVRGTGGAELVTRKETTGSCRRP